MAGPHHTLRRPWREGEHAGVCTYFPGAQGRPDATERAPNFLTLAIWDLSGSLPAFFDLLSEGQILSSLQNPKGITAAQGCLHVYEMQLLCWQNLCMGSGQVLTVPVLQMKRCSYWPKITDKAKSQARPQTGWPAPISILSVLIKSLSPGLAGLFIYLENFYKFI